MSCCSKPPQEARACKDASGYVARHRAEGPKVAVVACEGACVKGEVARVAANVLAYRLERERSVRICLGDAATADSGMRDLVAAAPRVVVIEGCGLHCATELLRPRLPAVTFTQVTASALYAYDRTKCFEIFDMPADELRAHAESVAARVQAEHFS